MHFNIKRYFYGISKRRFWLLLILFPPMFYIFVSAGFTDRFSIKQNISISKNLPLALASGPAGLKQIKEIISRPDDFFLNNYAVRKLYTKFYVGTAVYRADGQFRNLLEMIKNNMSIDLPSENITVITFYGKDKAIGQTLVSYYSNRFIQKGKEGLLRSKHKESGFKLPALMGNMEIDEHRNLWRPERLVPLVLITFISMAGVLMILAVLEWSDPSFKSERQVAQYLELPILGSLPDLNKISAALNSKRES
ncbi:MAG: hypothetical protein BMS9Abin03_354 [Thermodesulfobacteriota bacterium]|nr:MAG: hypothetical protein BMS9Abin03_354 [Thermodesulfobacteriota bacterium]